MDIFQHCKSITRLPFDFEPNKWEKFWSANCYEYLLNFQNSTGNPLTVGSLIGNVFQPYQSNEELIDVLRKELSLLGFSMEITDSTNDAANQKMKFFISRSRCGDYHFYRLDSNGEWSHKFSFGDPSNLDFAGNKITLPELACSTDVSIGYYLLGMMKE